jgi:hypothetical protein
VRTYEQSDRHELARGFRSEVERRFDLDIQVKKISALLWETLQENRRAPDVILCRKPFLSREDLPRFIRGKLQALQRSGLGRVVKKVLIHTPSCGRFRYVAENLYCAFRLMGFETRHLSFSEKAEECIRRFAPDLFITACAADHLSRLPLPLLSDLASRRKTVRLVWMKTHEPVDGDHARCQEIDRWVQGGMVGDVFISPVHPADLRGEGADWADMGCPVHFIPMAANPVVHLPKNMTVEFDIGFIGTNSAAKRKETETYLRPLLKRYSAVLRGDHWGKDIPPVPQNQAANIYGSARICPNFHHDFQKRRRFQLNERTFVIPACGGFEIMDEVPILREYFHPSEMVQAGSPEEWFSLHEEWLWRDGKRMDMAARAHQRVLAEHTYFDRVLQMLHLIRGFRDTQGVSTPTSGKETFP